MMKKIKLIFLFLWLIIGEPVFAGEVMEVSYRAQGAGLHLMNASVFLNVDKNTYAAQTIAETKGILSILLDGETIFKSDGKIVDNQFVPINSLTETLTKKKHKKRQLDFMDKQGFIDYQTALLQMMYLPYPQDRTFKVFDGKRELAVQFKYQGEQYLNTSTSCIYDGAVDYYTVDITVTAGKKKGWFFNRMNTKEQSPLRVYFGKAQGIKGKVLVRATFDTSIFGVISIDMKSLNVGGGK